MAAKAKKKTEKVSEKREKFLKMSEARLNKAVKAIELFGNLSSPNYEWGAEEIKRMINKMRGTTYAVESRFSRTRRWNAVN